MIKTFFVLLISVCVLPLTIGHEVHNVKRNLRAQQVDRSKQMIFGDAVLTASPSTVSSDKTYVQVTYTNVEDANISMDWVGVFDAAYANNMTALQEMAPIKFKKITSNSSQGTFKFQLLNYRVNLVFVYARGMDGNKYRLILAVSNVVTYENQNAPMHVHIATLFASSANYANTIMILWTQKQVSSPQIQYGLSPTSLTNVIQGQGLNVMSVSKTDFCDVDSEPAANDGYFVLGYRISGNLTLLKPNTVYFYRVGDAGDNNEEEGGDFSEVFNFTSSPASGDTNTPVRMIAYGDLGLVQNDYSDDEHNTETHSINTTVLIASEYLDKTDFVLHVGDISYARGYLSDWDCYLHQIQPITSRLPYMTGIGNHENGWSGEWVPPPPAGNIYGLEDSGGSFFICTLFFFKKKVYWRFFLLLFPPPFFLASGECSTVYSMYHRFSSNNFGQTNNLSERKPWYYFDYGMVRVVVMSTEHNWTIGSEQYNFIVSAMQSANRKTQPWLVLGGHRPMYWTTLNQNDAQFADYFQSQLEDVLYDNKVALALWGHIHNYGRTCPVYSQKCVSGNSAPVQMVIGMSGFDLDSSRSDQSYWLHQDTTHWGFTYNTFLNASHVHIQFIDDATNTPLDDFYVINPLFA
ncbi:hypothetical protein RFI_24884 [Reticulomyxa filosa]|uniref:Purple acid phosphatase n=1 Tax=Reticulomyxa filosa TaxID=46433 RepID=X6MHF4_RETFI|nr:hypothetical protein RFI_24884 [Reticulomyxa filosa]|eukprot:ETO12490.1 hypothetical protein RFI_24884 [Reticulomyxa filosa]